MADCGHTQTGTTTRVAASQPPDTTRATTPHSFGKSRGPAIGCRRKNVQPPSRSEEEGSTRGLTGRATEPATEQHPNKKVRGPR